MATHSSTLDRKIPWMEEPGRLQSMGPLRVRHGWATSLLEKEMATHPSVLAWRIPGMGEPGGLLSMGSHRVGHDWSDLAAAAAAAGGIYSVALSTLPYCFFFLLTTQRRLLAQLPLILVPISLLLGVGLRCNTCYLTIIPILKTKEKAVHTENQSFFLKPPESWSFRTNSHSKIWRYRWITAYMGQKPLEMKPVGILQMLLTNYWRLNKDWLES